MRNRIKTVLFTALLGGLSSVIHAAPQPAVIQAIAATGAKVKSSFPAGSGLTGWLIEQGGHDVIAYSTADGKRLLVGLLMDERGNNLMQQHSEQFIPNTELSKQMDKVRSLSHVKQGSGKKQLYVFFDPLCKYCHLLYLALTPYTEKGVTVNWVPVSVISETESLAVGSGILGAADKQGALRAVMLGKGAMPKPAPQHNAAVLAATEVMGGVVMARGTPVIVYDVENANPKTKLGMPTLPELDTITGVTGVKHTAPELRAFR